MAYLSDLTDEQWKLLESLLRRPGKLGPRHGADLRHVIGAMLYVTQSGCQWRYLPGEFGLWTRVWSQGWRWSRNGTWAMVLAELHRRRWADLGAIAVGVTYEPYGSGNPRCGLPRRGL